PYDKTAAISSTAASYDNGPTSSVVSLPNAYSLDEPTQQVSRVDNALGQTISMASPDAGGVRYLFDKGGRVRFIQDASSAVAGLIVYLKYDKLGRKVSRGTFAFEWNDETQVRLKAHANTPHWPEGPHQ